MRSKGGADRTRRADSRALTREASLSYRRSRQPLGAIAEEEVDEEEVNDTQELAEEVATSVLDIIEEVEEVDA